MIFVTVGTHEQQFNRLVEYMDSWAEVHDEEVVIQTGYSTYEPHYAKWQKLFPYEDMVKYVNEARIVITHGGPSSFIMPLQIGKIPIIVPRDHRYGEHVNNHQIESSHIIAERRGNIIVIDDVERLGETLERYDTIIAEKKKELISNNEKFCVEFEKIIKELIRV